MLPTLMKMVRKLSDELGKTVILVLHKLIMPLSIPIISVLLKNGKIAKYRNRKRSDSKRGVFGNLSGGL